MERFSGEGKSGELDREGFLEVSKELLQCAPTTTA